MQDLLQHTAVEKLVIQVRPLIQQYCWKMPSGLYLYDSSSKVEEDARAATKERSCTDPVPAGSRIYRSAVYGTLQSVTIKILLSVCFVRTICFCCTRVDERIGDDGCRVKNAAHIAGSTRA